MNPARWKRIEEVFDEVAELPEPDRAPFLARACGTDAELRIEIEALLASSASAPAALRAAIGEHAGAFAEDVPSAMIGRRLGRYRLVELLGEGGMGAVYRAERDDAEYAHRVAIKVLHYGLGSSHAIGRFRDERQILAGLDHPNIVKLLDGGSTDAGLPYLVMEEIDGVPISQFVSTHRLSVRERVELLVRACSAVQHAHQQLIVHRDLKPSNMLVTADGTPKLLDFGIAKLLDAEADREARTRTGMRMLTPEYASPEQARGEPVSTASDVFSLGAVLYHLLADVPPLAATVDALETLRRICEVDPPRPSTVCSRDRRSAIAGDLDNIVMKALHKEPSRRYASVEQLVLDLRRHLDGLPITARTATFGYRARKFVARNRGALALAVVVIGALSATTISSMRAASRADEQAQRAQRRLDDVRKLANSLLFELDEKIRDLKGAMPAREWEVSRALEYLDKLGTEEDDPEIQLALAMAYTKIGDIQGSSYVPSLGRASDGLSSYTKAAEIVERVRAGGFTGVELERVGLAVALGTGLMQQNVGDFASSRLTLRAARTALAAAPELAPDHLLVMRSCAGLIESETWLYELEAAHAHATSCIEGAVAWEARGGGRDARYWQAVFYECRANVRVKRADPDGAVEDGRRALVLNEALATEVPDDLRYERELAVAGSRLSSYLAGAGDSDLWTPNLGEKDEAERLMRRAVEIETKLSERDPLDQRSVLELSSMFANLGILIVGQRPEEAAKLFERANQVFEHRLPPAVRKEYYSRQIEWLSRCGLGIALARMGRMSEATAQLSLGMAQVDTTGPEQVMLAGFKFICTHHRALARHLRHEDDAAVATLNELLGELDRRRAAKVTINELVGAVLVLDFLAELRPADACTHRRRALATWRTWNGPTSAYTKRRDAELAAKVATCPSPG